MLGASQEGAGADVKLYGKRRNSLQQSAHLQDYQGRFLKQMELYKGAENLDKSSLVK
jgi:hypothetical protein